MSANLVEQSVQWKPSRYNWILPIEGPLGGGAVYNAYTGACIDFPGDTFQKVSELLDRNASEFKFSKLGTAAKSLGGALVAGGMVVDRNFDELYDLETRSSSRVDGLPLVLTINPTFVCNLGCNYCFAGKKQGLMSTDTEKALIKFVAESLSAGDVPSVSVDWFGGEPLIAKKSMERLSVAFLELCSQRNIPYRAQVITNGTLLNTDIAHKLVSWGVDRVQITLDGGEVTHNARRPWKGKSDNVIARSSFDDSLCGLESVIGQLAVRLRINVDRNNLNEAFDLLSLFDERGWLSPDLKFYPYISMVSDYTEASTNEWSPSQACQPNEFYEAHRRWLSLLHTRGIPVVGERLYGFPEPTTVACGAVSARGWVVNFDGQLHKCGFDGDKDSKSVGYLNQELDESNENLKYWTSYEPIADPKCRQCPALPVCLGGCARDRREDRSKAMAENCEFHLKYEPGIVAHHIRLRREKAAG